MGLPGIQELIIIFVVIGALCYTGLWPRVIQGIRELRGDAPMPTEHDVDLAYKILGLSSSATWPEIEQAYRKKAQVHHPDKGGDEDAMRVLNDVYAKLKKAKRP
jgi:preprotein translocase subunit Sec63